VIERAEAGVQDMLIVLPGFDARLRLRSVACGPLVSAAGQWGSVWLQSRGLGDPDLRGGRAATAWGKGKHL
jgi:hypothetical protein